MRLKRSRIKPYHHKKAIPKKDGEGNSYTEYSEAVLFVGEVWPAGGKIQAEMYGNRLSYIRNVRIQGTYTITEDEKGILHYVYDNGLDIVEGDGMCLYVSEDAMPDYKVISIKPYSHLRLEAEKLDHRISKS